MLRAVADGDLSRSHVEALVGAVLGRAEVEAALRLVKLLEGDDAHVASRAAELAALVLAAAREQRPKATGGERS